MPPGRDSRWRRANRAPAPGVVLSMRWVAFLGTAILVAACQRGAAPTQTKPPALGQQAREVAEDLFVCPGGYGWPAYGDLVYAPNDSSKPAADVRPDRCFASLDEATRAGFHLLPPPPGGLLIDTIYLVPPDPPILPICREASRRLGFTVLCPAVVPGDANSFVDCAIIGCVSDDALVLSFAFSGPPGYLGIPGQSGNHLFVLEARAGREAAIGFLGCDGPARHRGTVVVRRLEGTWIDCPAGSSMNSGHVMLVWTQRAIRYAVSLHSDTPVNRDLALAVADRLLAVSP
jgi:hypothetical protein